MIYTTNAILTPKQKRFYDALKDHIQEKGEAPTVSELAKKLKLSSPRAVTQYLGALERKGLIVRSRYARRGIRLREPLPASAIVKKSAADGSQPVAEKHTVMLPVIASAGCDNVNVFAQEVFDEYICVASELLQDRNKARIVSIRAVGGSMDDAGINEGDYVLVEVTEAVSEGDLIVAIIDSFAVIKKLEFANNAVILRPVSSDPQYRPIILSRDFKIFGKVIDVIRVPQRGDLEIVPLVSGY